MSWNGMTFLERARDKAHVYGIRTRLDGSDEYAYFSVDWDDIAFLPIGYAYVFKKRDAKKVVKELRALYPNVEFEIVKIP